MTTYERILEAIRSVRVGCGHADYVNEMYARAVLTELSDIEGIDYDLP